VPNLRPVQVPAKLRHHLKAARLLGSPTLGLGGVSAARAGSPERHAVFRSLADLLDVVVGMWSLAIPRRRNSSNRDDSQSRRGL